MTNAIRIGALWATAIVTAGFGLGLLFIPATLADQYGTVSTADTESLSRLFGAITLAFPVLAVLGLAVKETEGRRAIDATLFAGWVFIALADVYNVYGAQSQPATTIGTVTLVLYAAFAVVFGYLLFGEDFRLAPAMGRPASK